jgi:hypothetical protein
MRMKRSIKKLFVACAAVTAITAVSAVSASALTATPNSDGTAVTVKLSGSETVSGQTTILVLKGDYTTGSAASVNEDDIIYINQDADDVAQAAGGFLADNGVLPSETIVADQTYTAKVADASGDYIYQTTFTLGGGGGSEPSDRLLGDVDGNGRFYINDATAIVNTIAGLSTDPDMQDPNSETFKAADSDKNGRLYINDATAIVNYIAGLNSVVDGVTTISD